jgi:hypothetical protein
MSWRATAAWSGITKSCPIPLQHSVILVFLEAAANSLGEIGLAIPLSADSLGQDGAESVLDR